MNIGEAAKATGISTKMIRYYESIGLIEKSARTDSGYRKYASHELNILRFVKRARKVGFTLDQIRELLSLWKDTTRANSEVKAIAVTHVTELETRILELIEIRDTLKHLIKNCTSDYRPDCPILGELTEHGQIIYPTVLAQEDGH